MNKTKAYIGLGTNLGDRENHLTEAIQLLQQPKSIWITNSSNIYETDPVGYTDQGAFLNMVVEVTTTLSPHALFEQMMHVEQELGRKRDIRWGPRTIDLDLLLFGDLQINDEQLIVPHPRMHERAFVLVPLKDVYDIKLSFGTVEKEAVGVKLWKSISWQNAFEPSAN